MFFNFKVDLEKSLFQPAINQLKLNQIEPNEYQSTCYVKVILFRLKNDMKILIMDLFSPHEFGNQDTVTLP